MEVAQGLRNKATELNGAPVVPKNLQKMPLPAGTLSQEQVHTNWAVHDVLE